MKKFNKGDKVSRNSGDGRIMALTATVINPKISYKITQNGQRQTCTDLVQICFDDNPKLKYIYPQKGLRKAQK